MLGLVSRLPGERELGVDLPCRRDPAGRALGGLELVLQREEQESGDREIARRFARRSGGDPLEGAGVLRVELGQERGRHWPVRQAVGSETLTIPLQSRLSYICSHAVTVASVTVESAVHA